MSVGRATEAAGEDLTMESMSQNWRMFIIIGKIPIVLRADVRMPGRRVGGKARTR